MKVDFKKELKQLYNNPPAADFTLVDVSPMQFLMIDGRGDPNSAAEYTDALSALYPVAYNLKFMSKQELDRDYGVPPLEGLWWAADMDTFTLSYNDKSNWLWTMMIMTPDWITPDHFATAVETVRRKKNPAALDKVRLQSFHEGLSVQILHIGSYAAEAPTIARLHHQYLPQHGLTENGHHHEIYLSDPNRTEATKLKTILRQPVRQV